LRGDGGRRKDRRKEKGMRGAKKIAYVKREPNGK